MHPSSSMDSKKIPPQHLYFQSPPPPPPYPNRTTGSPHPLSFPNWRFSPANCYSCIPGPPPTSYAQAYLPGGGFPIIPAYAIPPGYFTGRMATEQDGYPFYVTQQQEKPPQPYIALIAEAIMKAPEKKLLLSDIYGYLLGNYPYFRSRKSGWRNSVRHNLSLNEIFVKAGRSPTGKGHYWTISEEHYEDVSKGVFRRKKDKKRRSAMAENTKTMGSFKRSCVKEEEEEEEEGVGEEEEREEKEEGEENRLKVSQTKTESNLETQDVKVEEDLQSDHEVTLVDQMSDDQHEQVVEDDEEEVEEDFKEHHNIHAETPCASGNRRSYDIEHLLSNDSKTESY